MGVGVSDGVGVFMGGGGVYGGRCLWWCGEWGFRSGGVYGGWGAMHNPPVWRASLTRAGCFKGRGMLGGVEGGGGHLVVRGVGVSEWGCLWGAGGDA